MGAGEDTRLRFYCRFSAPRRKLFTRGPDGLALLRRCAEKLKSVAAAVEMSQLGKDSQRSWRSRHDELQPYPLLGKQRLGQRYTKSTQSNLYGGANEFDLVDATGILHAHFDGERETGKGAEVFSTLLSEGRHGSPWFITRSGVHQGVVFRRLHVRRRRALTN